MGWFQRLYQHPAHGSRRLIHSGQRGKRDCKIDRSYTFMILAGHERSSVERERHVTVVPRERTLLVGMDTY